MDTIRYGVIGVGALGRHHARWARQVAALDLTGVYDIDQERSRRVAAEMECRSYASLDAILEACDAVSIAVTTSHHAAVAVPAANANVHLLIEKPIAATIADADRIIAAAEKNGVKLMVGHIERFNPAVRALSAYDIHPRFIEAHRLAAFNPRGSDVAVVLDLMIHDIDLALYLVRRPVREVSAAAVAVVSDTVDIANARLTFDGGTVANLTASRISLHPMRKLRLFQSSGYFSLDLAEKQADLYHLLDGEPADGETAVPLGASGRQIGYRKAGDPSRDMLHLELEAFAEAVRGTIPVPITGHDGREALAVALAVIEAGRKATEAFDSNG
jgi:predicted dehydrogenase